MQPNALAPHNARLPTAHLFACRCLLLLTLQASLKLLEANSSLICFIHTQQRSVGKMIFEVNQNESLSTAMGAPVKSVSSSECCWAAKSHAVGDNSNASVLKTVGNLTDLFKMG